MTVEACLKLEIPLVGLTSRELGVWAESVGEPAYRGHQIARWLYERGVDAPEQMTDIPAALRHRLEGFELFPALEIIRRQRARDGTEKFLFRLEDQETIETVVLPFQDRTSICISSQAGCPIRCTFCATGKSGYARNLKTGEIVGQLLRARRFTGRDITHVVFMGMGEPLLNTDRVLKSARLMHDEIGIPMRRITVSTVGLPPEMRRLADEREPLTLALSLHAPDDRLREQLVPVGRRYPISELLEACDYYREKTGRRVTFEYVLLRGVNDREEHARALAALLRGRRSHVNLIPYNPGAANEFQAPTPREVTRFRGILEAAGVPVTQRMEKGQEIMAACGQLRKRNEAAELFLSRPGSSETGRLNRVATRVTIADPIRTPSSSERRSPLESVLDRE